MNFEDESTPKLVTLDSDVPMNIPMNRCALPTDSESSDSYYTDYDDDKQLYKNFVKEMSRVKMK